MACSGRAGWSTCRNTPEPRSELRKTLTWRDSFAIALVIPNGLLLTGGRALYGLARERMTLRQLDHLNRWGVPGRALTLDAVPNSLVVLLLGEPLAILVASNFGYLVAVTLAVAAFLLLRRDRPHWPRPIRRSRIWIPIAWALLAFNLVVIAAGVTHPSLAGYGGTAETLVGAGILLLSVILYVYRRVIQDRERIAWRIPTPSVPEEAEDVAVGAEDGSGAQKREHCS